MTEYTLADEVDYFEEVIPGIFGGVIIPRSKYWQKTRLNHVNKNPYCYICHTKHSLQVHHKKPFHIFPHLELEEDNLITLCENHHLYYGHWGDWKSYNPTLETTIKQILTRPYKEIIV